MKRRMLNLGIAMVLMVATNVVIGSELKWVTTVENANELAMEIEPWMVSENFLEMEKDDGKGSSVVDIAISNPDFSILVDAVVKANLAEALSGDGPFTVFAPTNDAFEELFSKLGIKGIDDLTAGDLAPILTYHVVAGKVMSGDLSNIKVATLNEGNSISIEIGDGVTINDSKVVAADIEGSNGVIHVIDKVLMPE